MMKVPVHPKTIISVAMVIYADEMTPHTGSRNQLAVTLKTKASKAPPKSNYLLVESN